MAEETVAVGMSGGVDSSVAAALLVEQGYDVVGVTMQIWDDSYDPGDAERSGHACFGPGEEADIEDARDVAGQLGIPFHQVDLRDEYEEIVLGYFRDEYSRGRTPNPCLRCNQRLKFNALLDGLAAEDVDWDFYATGHYVRRGRRNGNYLLLRGRDDHKDQSYFLHRLSPEKLSRTLFPLGELEKEQVRARAEELGLKVQDKGESQDFYAGDYTELLDSGTEPGPIVDAEGRELGEHDGIANYTIGQRRGLGISANKPLYVTRLEPEENRVVVGDRQELFGRDLTVADVNWIVDYEEYAPDEVQVKIRYRHPGAPAELSPGDNGRVDVRFNSPQRAITPGQAAVFYSGDVVLGGGTIESTPD